MFTSDRATLRPLSYSERLFSPLYTTLSVIV